MGIAGVNYGGTVPYQQHVNSRTGKKAEARALQNHDYSANDPIFNSGGTDKAVNSYGKQKNPLEVAYQNLGNPLVNLQHEQQGSVKMIEGPNGAIEATHREGKLKSGIIAMIGFGTGDNFQLLEARYTDGSTKENPIIEVRISKEYGAPAVFNVNINDIDPKNATQLEMFALCSHADTQGISTASRSGDSYLALGEYAGVGGYKADNIADFVGKKRDWTQIVEEAEKEGVDSSKNIADIWTQMLKDLFEKFTKDVSDEKYTDSETGMSWYIGEDGIPYILEEDTETLISLCKDRGESSLESIAPNAPDEVKQAWVEASKETGINGLGIQGNGMMSHITQLGVQRAVKWYKGEDTDILGKTVESAREAIKKALYDLEHPLEPFTNRSSSVQQAIEKEKAFYKAFLEKLSI